MCRLTPFGVWEGREVPCIELSDGEYAVELLPYGAAVRAIYVPDRNGDRRDICLVGTTGWMSIGTGTPASAAPSDGAPTVLAGRGSPSTAESTA